jgi:hypothetical protein
MAAEESEEARREYAERVQAGGEACNSAYWACKAACDANHEIEIGNPYSQYGSWNNFWTDYGVYTWSRSAIINGTGEGGGGGGQLPY